MCKQKRKSVFLSLLLLLFLFSALPALSQEKTESLLSELPSELLAQPLPVFPVSENLLSIPSPTPTEKPETLNERTALQLEAWIAYQQEVKAYVLKVNNWSSQVTTSWNQVKVSSTNYESATKNQIETRDTEIKNLKGDRIKYAAIGFVSGIATGLLIGVLAK